MRRRGTLPRMEQPSPSADSTELWTGRPSQLLNIKHFLFAVAIAAAGCALIAYRSAVVDQLTKAGADAATAYLNHIACGLIGFSVLYAWLRWLLLASRRYRLLEGVLELTTGLLSQRTDLLELFRVRDLTEERPFLMRLFGLGTIRILSGDSTTPDLDETGIRDSHRLLDLLRAQVSRSRGPNRVMKEERE